MSVQFIENKNLFILSCAKLSCVFYVDANKRLVHLHFGGKVLGEEGLLPQEIRKGHSSFPQVGGRRKTGGFRGALCRWSFPVSIQATSASIPLRF